MGGVGLGEVCMGEGEIGNASLDGVVGVGDVFDAWVGEGGMVENKGSEGMGGEVVGGVLLVELKEDTREQVGKRNWSTVVIVFGMDGESFSGN